MPSLRVVCLLALCAFALSYPLHHGLIATDCLEKDETTCNADTICTWCVSEALPSSCHLITEAKNLPHSVFNCTKIQPGNSRIANPYAMKKCSSSCCSITDPTKCGATPGCSWESTIDFDCCAGKGDTCE
jgi:hypothetical protein